MPTYQYRCTECGHDLEVVQKFSDPSLTVCPNCQGALRKVFNAVGVVFKGTGFYRTDSRGPDTHANSGSGSSSEKSSSDSAGSSGSESSSKSDSNTGTSSKGSDSAGSSSAGTSGGSSSSNSGNSGNSTGKAAAKS